MEMLIAGFEISGTRKAAKKEPVVVETAEEEAAEPQPGDSSSLPSFDGSVCPDGI